jgi:hypothetical protein
MVVQAIMVAGWLQNLSTDGTEQDLEAKELVLDHLGGQVRGAKEPRGCHRGLGLHTRLHVSDQGELRRGEG